jgi:hypothetical protein
MNVINQLRRSIGICTLKLVKGCLSDQDGERVLLSGLESYQITKSYWLNNGCRIIETLGTINGLIPDLAFE